jgi:2,3-bisphosphoglycerate-independent phosphoglycerate mutase
MAKEKIIFIIRDGWGYRAEKKENAIREGKVPFNNFIMKNYPTTLLDASGPSVGLPKGYQGNSEVGHMTIGSGRIIYQSLDKINNSIKDKTFFSNEAFNSAIENAKKNKTTLHIIGLIQEEGVHSHLSHIIALLELCKKKNFQNVLVHCITDGRDAPVTKSLFYVKKLIAKMKKMGVGKIATIQGRFYAMDRDKRWERTQKAYDCIVLGKTGEEHRKKKISEKEFLPGGEIQAIEKSHAQGKTDEFILPTKLVGYNGVHENDSIIFTNFRTDRTRQLTSAIVESEFSGWERKPLQVFFTAMTQFYSPMNAYVAFPEVKLTNLLGEVISKAHFNQLRISETEKYAHVTFFFNGQQEKPFEGEDRILIPSPKVQTYDQKPEMSVKEIANRLCDEIQKKNYDFVVTNLVNGDMVGHTGIKKAIIKGVEAVDSATKQITEKALELGYTIFIFADHGNAEDQTIKWRTSHTTNKVPFIIVSNNEKLKKMKLKKGKGLSDIAPTALKLMNISIPKEMSGESII